MSNTAMVTPYSQQIVRAVGEAVSITASVVRWLLESPVDTRVDCDKLHVAGRPAATLRTESPCINSRMALQSATINVARLHVTDHDMLLHAAKKLGYRLEPASTPRRRRTTETYRLRHASGDRLAISRKGDQLTVHTAGDARKVHELVRQHTIDRVTEHFTGLGMQVQTTVSPNGEIQIQAQEPNAGHRDGPARITTNVCADGTAVVDVDGVRGNRCMRISAGIASALGGQLSAMNKKSSYYQIPVEPARVEVRG